MTFRLHNFFRSSTSVRLRAALNLKGLGYHYVAYALRKGETRTPAYRSINPAGLVPALERADGLVMTQSFAIMEWLDETHPEPPLLPDDPDGRARVRALNYLGDTFGADEGACRTWFTHWMRTTFDALETTLARDAATGRFCHGDTPASRTSVSTRRFGATAVSISTCGTGRRSPRFSSSWMPCRHSRMRRHTIGRMRLEWNETIVPCTMRKSSTPCR